MSEANFWKRVNHHNLNYSVCWEWLGQIEKGGYGRFYANGKHGAHRFSYELMVGDISEGMEIAHTCNNPVCVNPKHLKPSTRQANGKRKPLFCPKSHPYSGENLYTNPRGDQECRTCRNQARYERKERLVCHL